MKKNFLIINLTRNVISLNSKKVIDIKNLNRSLVVFVENLNFELLLTQSMLVL